MANFSMICANHSRSTLRLTSAIFLAVTACSNGSGSAALSSTKSDDSSQALTTVNTGTLSPTAASGMCLQPQDKSLANGTPIVLAVCDGSSQQTWTTKSGMLSLDDSHCIDVTDGKHTNGNHLQLWDCGTSNTNQQWTAFDNGFQWTNTNICMDLPNGNTSAGTVIGIWTCNAPNNNQVWILNGQSVSVNANTTTSTTTSSNSNATSGSTTNTGTMSGYVHTSGTNIVDGSGNTLSLRGTNVGGWLVTENWMDGMTDSSDNASSSNDNSVGRFAKETLEGRFGESQALTLMNVWYDNFFTTQDLDNIKNMGMNVIRVPFGYRNLQHPDGSWVLNSAGSIDFSRLDWVVSEAGKRGIYVIPDFHIWNTQRQNYQLISTNTDGGKAALAQAAAIWTEVAKHFKGNNTIAAFDVINEPTGSYGNLMQIALYNAVRAQDSNRMIVMESIDADPGPLGWNNVVYSIHEYGMMGTNFATNQASFNSDLNGNIKKFKGYNIPVYIGEFMVQGSGQTLPWLLNQYNSNNLAWTPWTYKAVNMGSWAYYNLSGNLQVNILSDSYQSIQNAWSNMGTATADTVLINAAMAATGN